MPKAECCSVSIVKQKEVAGQGGIRYNNCITCRREVALYKMLSYLGWVGGNIVLFRYLKILFAAKDYESIAEKRIHEVFW